LNSNLWHDFSRTGRERQTEKIALILRFSTVSRFCFNELHRANLANQDSTTTGGSLQAGKEKFRQTRLQYGLDL